jgi:molybdopterin-containing oxidoreductase family iron-sulfur binding subunit
MIPTPQGHPYDEDRDIVQTVSLTRLRELQDYDDQEHHPPEHEFKDLLQPHEHPVYRWGMVVDRNACIGCSACVVACYAENNIPVVGRDQYLRGREMGWIRIERYYKSRPGEAQYIPMFCQQCDNAPCEPVCPVFATYHTHEGLNAQIYNRCVGTRYCANNCPFGVRRFNWFNFGFPEPLNLQLNPNVTVRSKGVMEKCTFCIQRIVHAKDLAKDENRKVKDGEVVPACAQTCPTQALTFGNLKDPRSEVVRKARGPRGYKVFEHLNTKPAVTYLKKITTRDDLV